jgi:glyoxylase-like metal-dependent hydrolase (beta-lactamase superfamily II)
MGKADLQKCILGSVSTNCYFLKNKETKEILIVDPADAPGKIERKVSEMDGTVAGILLTHGHFDHILAANAVQEKYGVKIYACKEEQQMLEDASVNMTAQIRRACQLKADVWLDDLDVFEVAGFSIQMIHTPGHTKGSCCYYLKDEGILFSGDTLFYGSVGRTDFPGGSTAEIVRSLHRLVDSLPEDTEVFPGHDASTTIGYEKRYNPFV